MAPIVTHRLIVPDAAEQRWLVTAAAELPRIDTPDAHTADTEYLNAAVFERWGLTCTMLQSVHHSEIQGDRVRRAHVFELDGDPPPGLVWCDTTSGMPDAQDRDAIARWRTAQSRGVVDGREWTQRGWRRQARQWLDENVRRVGGGAVLEVVQMRAWPSSSVWRVTADALVCYFKGLPASVVSEARVTSYLATRFGDFVPRLLAADLDRRWLLTEAFPGAALDAAPDPDRWERAAFRYGELQALVSADLAAVEALGCVRRTSAMLAAELPMLIADTALLTELRRRCEVLENSRLPWTLEHGDLWPGNVLSDDSTSVVIDWEDACIARPLIGLAPFIVGLSAVPIATEAVLARVQRAYLGAFTRYAPMAELEALLNLALPLAFCDMALRYRHQRPSVTSQHPWMRGLVPEALQRAAALCGR